jgi:hypothetical protein
LRSLPADAAPELVYGASMKVGYGFAVAAFLLLVCCMPSRDAKPTVAARAEADLGCLAEKLEVTEIAECTYVAQGCGKRAKYVVHPHSERSVACCPLSGCYATRER